MKINGDPTGISASGIDRQSPVPAARTQGEASGSGAIAGDRLELSGDLQTIRSAIDTAASLPDVRQDVVDRMKAMLADGTLGADAAELANAIIDRWLTTP